MILSFLILLLFLLAMKLASCFSSDAAQTAL